MCTLEKKGNLFILTLTGDDEHRLNPTLIDSIQAALLRAKVETTGPSALITTSQGKFFSNGYDLQWAQSDTSRLRLMDSKLRSLVSDLINFPMPTIAAVTGHASAAGFIFALSHDYILMRKDRGFLYMSELDIGLKIPRWFVAMVKSKVRDPAAWREIILKASKITAVAAVEKGIVDLAYDSAEETVKGAMILGEELVRRKWEGNLYGETRRIMIHDLLEDLRLGERAEDHETTTRNLAKL